MHSWWSKSTSIGCGYNVNDNGQFDARPAGQYCGELDRTLAVLLDEHR